MTTQGKSRKWCCAGRRLGFALAPIAALTLAGGWARPASAADPGDVAAWGFDGARQTEVPSGLVATQVSGGSHHSLALRSNGTVAAWGCATNFGQCNVPDGLSGVVAVSAGSVHSLALKSDGKVVAWGCGVDWGQCNVPADLEGVTAISGGQSHSLALKSNGKVVAWGCGPGGDLGQCSVPADLEGVTAIAAGSTFSLALKSNGTVVAFGCHNIGSGPCAVPSDLADVTAIAAGEDHSLALKSNGKVVAWGCSTVSTSGECNVPADLEGVTAIAGGAFHSLALKGDDTVVGWGCGSSVDVGQCTPPAGLTGVTAIGAGRLHSLAVYGDKVAPVAQPSQSPAANGNGWNNGTVTVTWNWMDNAGGRGIDSSNCTVSSSVSGDGVHALTAHCADLAGNVGSANYTVQIDGTAPAISGARAPAPNGAGWNNSAVTVNFICTDGVDGSGVATNTVAGATLSSEGQGQSVTNTGTCVDNAGNVATSRTVGNINIDLTPPTLSAAATTEPNGNHWYNSNVTVNFICGDNLSTVASCPADQVLSDEGIAVASTAQTATDKAGNVSALSNVVTAQIDKTAPVVAVTGVSNGAVYALGSVPTAGCTTDDTLSGVASPATVSVTGGNSGGTGAFTATCSGATDNAGNSGSAGVSYTVAFNWTGFFQPVDNLPTVNTANAGQGIAVKFSLGGNYGLNIFADGSPVSQNVACSSSGGGDTSPIDETVTTSNSGLQYDAATQTYTYVWKTDKSWAGTCRTLAVRLIDGTTHTAFFKFNAKGR